MKHLNLYQKLESDLFIAQIKVKLKKTVLFTNILKDRTTIKMHAFLIGEPIKSGIILLLQNHWSISMMRTKLIKETFHEVYSLKNLFIQFCTSLIKKATQYFFRFSADRGRT